jgi:oligopeptide/dipeptide ABC transporter ATP-binding protein
MYLGHVVEEGAAEAIMDQPRHPYTQALISAVPVPGAERKERTLLRGELPSPARPPAGCPFHTRCPRVLPACRSAFPARVQAGQSNVACHLYPP